LFFGRNRRVQEKDLLQLSGKRGKNAEKQLRTEFLYGGVF
jgi:hypothetical protein